ncbi:alpha/beta hydrolase family protein [Vibrio owensii]|uniref:alpha/beta hydrolase family protein n=1 Tax=Vibrio owensii TaxID=696485 RepID=UPI003AAB23FB
MTLKKTGIACTLLSLLAFAPLYSFADTTTANQQVQYSSSTVSIPSRNITVPATLVTPTSLKNHKYPLVVISHGHGGSRDENGGLTLLAETLAQNGIASIRMDYAGCGESTDSFVNNTPENMLTDTIKSLEFAIANAQIDLDNIAVFGYSMGGRVSMSLATQDERIKAAGFLAPATDSGNSVIQRIVGSKEMQEKLFVEAKSKKGYADFTTHFGSKQKLSKDWFEQLTQQNPIDKLSSFRGDLFVACGTDEAEVRKEACNELYTSAQKTAKSVNYANIQDADHGYGFWNGRDDVKENTVNVFVDFFVEKLK